jgi:hypothetical protein
VSDLGEVRRAAARIDGVAHRTPVNGGRSLAHARSGNHVLAELVA